MSNFEKNEVLNIWKQLSKFDDFLNSTNISSMKMEIDNNPELKKIVDKDFNEINLSYLSTYEKYGINMKTLQNELLKKWFDLWKYWADGHFWSYTFIAIVKFQKSMWLEVTWLANKDLLKFIYPNVFVTLNKNEWRSVNDTLDYVKNTISNYSEWIKTKKDVIKLETQKEVKKVKNELINKNNAKDKDLDSEKAENDFINEIKKYKELKKIQLSVINEQKDDSNKKINDLTLKIDELKEKIEANKISNEEAKNDWNPFNNEIYDKEIESLQNDIDVLNSKLMLEIKRLESINIEITEFKNNQQFQDYDDNWKKIIETDKVKLEKLDSDKKNETNLEIDEIEDIKDIEDKEKRELLDIDYVIKKGDTIWWILMNEIWSETIAALSKWIRVFPWDIVKITEDFITIDWKNWDYKIDISEWRYDFFPKFKMKKITNEKEKRLTKKRKDIYVETKKEIINQDIEVKKDKEYLVKKWDLLRRIIYKHFNDHKIANLFNNYRVNIWDKIIFSENHVELSWRNINEVVLTWSIEKDKEIENNDISDFMNLSISQRFEKITTATKDWYFIIDFNKNFDKKTAKILERKVSINDIIPSQYNSCEVIVDTEAKVWRKWKKKIAHKNYFDVVSRNELNEFDSKLSWRKYNSTIIKDWYAIKPFIKDFKDFDNTLVNKDTKHPALKVALENEIFIRNMYWKQISWYIEKYFKSKWSVIDENFFYSLLKQESHFDPNALSHTWTRWLWMITLDTTLWIIRENKRLLKNENFMKANPWIEDLLIINMDSITGNEKFEKYNHSKWWFHWVDTQFYNPEKSIKLSLSFLMNIEKSLSFIKDPELKKDAILATYNGWTIIRSILKDDPNIDSWSKLKSKLKFELSEAKFKEVVWYVNRIRKTC